MFKYVLSFVIVIALVGAVVIAWTDASGGSLGRASDACWLAVMTACMILMGGNGR